MWRLVNVLCISSQFDSDLLLAKAVTFSFQAMPGARRDRKSQHVPSELCNDDHVFVLSWSRTDGALKSPRISHRNSIVQQLSEVSSVNNGT